MEIDDEIRAFKLEVKNTTEWETGYHILDFIDSYKAFEYGKLIGERNIINKKKRDKN